MQNAPKTLALVMRPLHHYVTSQTKKNTGAWTAAVPPEVLHTCIHEDLTLYFQQYGDLEDVYIPPGGKAYLATSCTSAKLNSPFGDKVAGREIAA
eukprot:659823-Amphidinium_carterae.1